MTYSFHSTMNTTRTQIWAGILGIFMMAGNMIAQGSGGCITLTNGYFWDPMTTNYWVPHGFAYQTINSAVGASQTKAQIDYDFLEMRKIHADSLRVDFTWGEIETADGTFDWTMTDYIVDEAEKYGFRIFPLIGYQYPPSWFSSSWKAIDASNRTASLLNYEHPSARAAYTDFIARITSRYKDSKAVAGWILGNEYAYFDLWDYTASPHLFVGFDTNYSLPSFRSFLTNLYSNSIASLNSNWKTNYTSFNDVVMPQFYPANTNRYFPAYHDLIQWRKKSVGDFIAIGAVAAKQADTNHLVSYSMVGGIYNGFDANNTCEDNRAIVERCIAAGAPLDFWSINNYAWASEGSELRAGQFGIVRHRDQSGLPVLVTETGHSSTDTLFTEEPYRYSAALPGQLWEALMSGAAGVHIFTWNDRRNANLSTREQGFGIVQTNRLIKSPVYGNILETFRRMEQVNVNHLFGASADPVTDVQFFWGIDSDMVWPRANQENCFFWGGMKRLGYSPRFIDERQFDAGAYTNARALILSRCYQLAPQRLDALVSNVIPAGVSIYANADVPGRFDAYGQSNTEWAARMNTLFGLNVANAYPAWHAGGYPVDWPGHLQYVILNGANALGPITNSYSRFWMSWEIWNGITANSGTSIIMQTGFPQGASTSPALHIQGHGAAGKAAINTIALGDIGAMLWGSWDDNTAQTPWEEHYDWSRAVLRDWFGIMPQLDLSGSSRFYVTPDYRTCTNGSVLISLLNESTNATTVTLTATNLIRGLTVERLSSASGILETNSDGVVSVSLAGDEYVLLYAYTNNASIANPGSSKLWIASEPAGFWPSGRGATTKIGYDTRGQALDLYLGFERADSPYTRYAWTNVTSVSGVGTNSLDLVVPNADLGDTNYLSSPDGRDYILHAWLQNGGTTVSECRLPTRMAWGARPTSIPSSVATGQTYSITVNWQELPSYKASEAPTPLSRAATWQPALTSAQPYTVFLDLMTGSVAVVTSNALTYSGTSSNRFSVTVPGLIATQFWWRARTVSGNYAGATSNNHDVADGFEDRARGDSADYISPWEAFTYSGGTFDLWARGVDTNCSEGTNAAFVIGNSVSPGSYGGIGMARTYSTAWALPEPKSEWSNIWFAFDFRETNVRSGTLTMKVEDSSSGAIEYTTNYSGGGWLTISSRLSRFVTSSYPGTFNSNDIKKLTVLLQTGSQTGVYFCSFDNIRFVGTPWVTNSSSGSTDAGNDLIDSFEDRTLGEQMSPSPWTLGSFGTGGQYYQNFGFDTVPSQGSKGCWQVFWSHTNALGTSAYYMAYTYANSFALPTNLATVGFSFDFYEKDNRSTKIEMQVKDSTGGYSSYSKTYAGAGPWDTISANLDQFTGTLNPNDVKEIDILVWMLQCNTQYLGHIDNVRFTGTVSGVSGPYTNGLYLSINDTPAGGDTDGDGILDAYETNTGTWNGPTDTGTNPNNPDSDGDGMNDGNEVIAGTNPNIQSDCFTMDSVSNNASGFVVEWFARTGRVYGVHYLDGSLATNSFSPLSGWTNITVTTDGWTTIVDTTADGAAFRFYRLNVRQTP